MAIASGLPVPACYVLEDPGINAFAAGWSPSDAVVAVTRGILEILDERELRGVLAAPLDPLTDTERRDWIARIRGVSLVSDGFIPFRDNIEHAQKHGVSFIAQPGGSTRDDEIEAGVNAFEDGVGRKRRWHEDGGDGGAGGFHGVGDGVEDRHFVRAVFEEEPALAGGDTGDDLRAVVEGELGVATAEIAGDALDKNLGGGSDENGHVVKN